MAQGGERSPRGARHSDAPGGLRLGDLVWVGPRQIQGLVRFFGPTDFATGEWLGVELSAAFGKNDGSIHGRRYFNCQPSCGIFMRPSALKGRTEDGGFLAPSVDLDPQLQPKLRRGQSRSTTSLQGEAAMASPPSPYDRTPERSPATPDRRSPSTRGLSSTDASGSPLSCSSPAFAVPLRPPYGGHVAGSQRPAAFQQLVSPRAAEAELAARRALAEAAEEHDVEALGAAIRSAQATGVSAAELEGAQRVLQYEMQRRLFEDFGSIRAEVEALEAQVAATTRRAVEAARRAEEVNLLADQRGMAAADSPWSDERLESVAEKVEEKVWARLRGRMEDMAGQLAAQHAAKLEGTLAEMLSTSAELEALLQAEVPQGGESQGLRRISGASGCGGPEDEEGENADDEEGLMRFAFGMALLGASGNKPLGKKTDQDELVSMSTMDTENRSAQLTPRELRSPRSASTTPRRMALESGTRDELIQLLHFKLDHQGSRKGLLGKPEMRRFANMCGFVGNDARWDSEWEALEVQGGWDPSGLDAAAFAQYVESQRVTTQELQCMCRGLQYVRGQTSLFDFLDVNGDGYVDRSELEKGLQQGIVQTGYRYTQLTATKE